VIPSVFEHKKMWMQASVDFTMAVGAQKGALAYLDDDGLPGHP